MNAAEFHQSRKFAATPAGRIAYIERGAGPVALFLHGYLLNGFAWRGTIEDLSPTRRCIALDVMGLGYSEIPASQDLTFQAQAGMVASFLDQLKIDQVDLIGNDSGGGISQMFAAGNPSRVRTLTLTNCEVHDLWPNPTLQQLFEMLSSEAAIPALSAALNDPATARQAFGAAYEDPSRIPDEAFRAYLEPLLSADDRIANARRFARAEPNRYQLIAMAPKLKQLKVPTQIIWGDGDAFFELASIDWLRQNIQGVRKVTVVPGARLFFPEEHPKLLSVLLNEFWRSVA